MTRSPASRLAPHAGWSSPPPGPQAAASRLRLISLRMHILPVLRPFDLPGQLHDDLQLVLLHVAVLVLAHVAAGAHELALVRLDARREKDVLVEEDQREVAVQAARQLDARRAAVSQLDLADGAEQH